MNWLVRLFKKAFEYGLFYTTGEWNVRKIDQGLSYETKVDIRRKDTAIVTAQIIPTARTVKEKNNYFLSNFDSIKMESEMFIRQYIKTMLPFSLEDHIAVINMEVLIDDAILKYSLEKVALKLTIIEIQFDKDKDKRKDETKDMVDKGLKKDYTKDKPAWS